MLDFKKRGPRFAIKYMKTFFGGHTKKGFNDLRGREFVVKNCIKIVSGSLGKSGQKSFATPKICLLLHLWWKGTCTPVAPLLKGQRDECPGHASIFRLPCAYYSTRTLFTRCCSLQFVIVMKINYQRSPKTEQFMTSKIPGNALKQGNRTHSMLRPRGSQLQKYKAAWVSRRIAVDQKVCGWDGEHPGLTIWNL